MKADASQIRRAADRGHCANDWLDAHFSFSFGDWHDPMWPRFGPLLAINEDHVQPGRGFAMHPHADLEVLMLPRRGRIEHRDNFGAHTVAAPGELLFMRAGTGIRHSQMNPSPDEIDHHVRIRLEPRTNGLKPQVHTLRLTPPGAGGWVMLASGAGAGGMPIDADATVSWGRSRLAERATSRSRAAAAKLTVSTTRQNHCLARCRSTEAPTLLRCGGCHCPGGPCCRGSNTVLLKRRCLAAMPLPIMR